MSSIYVLLPPTPVTAQAEFEYLVSSDGQTVSVHAQAVPALLPLPAGAGSEVVAIAPAAALSWHQVTLPRGAGPRSPRLRAVLEGLLEERLLDDPDQLHFAVQPQAAAEAPAWVVACDRAWLRSALQVLEMAGRPAARVVPEFAPEGEPALYALDDPDLPQLAYAGADGVLLLPLASSSLALLPPDLPAATPVVAEPAVASLAEQVLQRPPQLQPTAARLLAAARTRWDLAQFEFASSGRARTMKKLSTGWADLLRAPQWRPARWAAAVLVAAQLLGLNAWAWKERSALAAKREAARTVLTDTFPQVRAVVDAPVQMDREVAALRQVTGGMSSRDLEAQLGALAAAAPPGRAATALEFNGSELRVRGLAASEAEARPVLQALRSQGYAGTLQGDTLVVRAEGQP
ncbi:MULTISPECIES: type II secretion system protein GspL [Ramlibacter]|uniref:General secretion pathway protein GspL n=1 Tax=Ramlibacter pinisoli TaxID=2682844 RepID=A0A6N8IW66_9BURK|nr:MULTISPECIES: type II secretion system protein GspL [Ramlibacter]MBA2965386.1 general secretion pathway protein GspL [Ramlibacter sp. CGMCC 1.13660]MVQ30350.1 general secretion pathway protein GspL [Ramlibacter pinisoli]